MNKLDKDYQSLLKDIIDNGIIKKDRTGTGTISVFGRQIRHKMSDGFPLLTTKKMYWKGIVTELLWFLRGDTNIKYLVDNGCHIWDGDAYKNYDNIQSTRHAINEARNMVSMNGSKPLESTKPLSQEEFINRIKTDDEFAKKWGELGHIYGKQWRSWDVYDQYRMSDTEGNRYYGKVQSIDQIANLINDLKTNPDSRRLMVSAWNVGELDSMVLPPCHYGFQVYTRELSREERMDYWFKNNKPNRDVCDSIDESSEEEQHKYFDGANVPKRAISLMFNMRSNDVPLGLPFNIASYGLLLEIIGRMVNMIPDELIANLGDAHIYNNQIDGVKEQLTRTPMKLPNLIISDDVNFNGTIDEFLESCNKESFKLNGYESHPSIKIPLSN